MAALVNASLKPLVPCPSAEPIPRKQHFDLLVECGRARDRPAAGGLRVEIPAPAAAAPAESTQAGELVHIAEGGRERLPATHQQSGLWRPQFTPSPFPSVRDHPKGIPRTGSLRSCLLQDGVEPGLRLSLAVE